MILSPTPLRPGNQGALQAVATAPHHAVPEAACIRYRRLTQELPPACMPPSPLRPTVAGCLREPCPAAVLSVSPPRPTRFRVRTPKNVKTPAAVQSKTVLSEEQTKSDAYRSFSGRRPAPPQGCQPWFRWSGSSARSHPAETPSAWQEVYHATQVYRFPPIGR